MKCELVYFTYQHISTCPPCPIILLAQLLSLVPVTLVLAYIRIDLSVAQEEHEHYRDKDEEFKHLLFINMYFTHK
jgi:hypothetical protein